MISIYPEELVRTRPYAYAEAFSDLGKEIEDKSSEGLWCELPKHTFFSPTNSVIPVAEKHFGAILLALFSITTILMCRKLSAMMPKLPSNTGVRGDLVCATCGLLML